MSDAGTKTHLNSPNCFVSWPPDTCNVLQLGYISQPYTLVATATHRSTMLSAVTTIMIHTFPNFIMSSVFQIGF